MAKSHAAAHVVEGEHIIFPEEVTEARAVTYSSEQLKHLAETLPDEQQLRWLRENNYAVVAGPPTPMSVLEVRALSPQLFVFETDGWYAVQSFASTHKAGCEWLVIRKAPLPLSTKKTWDVQQKLLSKDEEVPNAAEISWFITTYYEVKKTRLFSDVYVRTSSVNSDGDRVSVGYFGEVGLSVGYYWDGDYRYDLGVAASRMF